MRKFASLILLTILLAACTKEVPETEKKISKSASETEIHNLLSQYEADFNLGNLDKAISYLSNDFCGYIPDADSGLDVSAYKTNLLNFISQHPEGKIKINIEYVFVNEDFSATQAFTSYLTMDPIEKKMSPVYSERSIFLLRKVKSDGWKIFRSLSSAAFSYD